MSRAEKCRAALACTLVAAVPIGLAFGSPSAASNADVKDDSRPSAVASTDPDWPYNQSPSEAIGSTLPGLDSDWFLNVRVGEAPPDAPRQGQWLYVTLEGGDPASGGLVARQWEEDLAAGAIADRMSGTTTELSSVLVGSTVVDSTSAADVQELPSGIGMVAAHQVFDAQLTGISDSTIILNAQNVLSKFGLDSPEVRVLHPLGPALYVSAEVPDPTALEGQLPLVIDALNPGAREYEGLYLELRDPTGEPLLRSGASARTGTGHVWFAPGMDKRLGVLHG